MSEQDGTQNTTLERPKNDDEWAWRAYWEAQGQPWRTQPEIDAEQQKYLAARREIKSDVWKGIYPFKDIKLKRADVEWLLATHEGRGPVMWNDENLCERNGLDLRSADLRGEDLHDLPLTKCDFRGAQLTEAVLIYAQLIGANLRLAQLSRTKLYRAKLQGSDLTQAKLDGADLTDVLLADAHNIGPKLADVQWGDTNLAVVDWTQITILGEEHWAQQNKIQGFYKIAVRAYRQLSIVLRNQGLNEDAARFAFRAQRMQRKVYWHQSNYGQYYFSGFLNLLSGYGYRFWRSFFAYAFVIVVFAAIYYHFGPHLLWYESIVISMTAFHGRGFFQTQFNPGDPQAIAAAIEALVGLFIEITLIATLTQRLFGK